ncbi:MAG: tetratricopeptide (TPR) repeat protein [Pseudoalteromonas distincta]|jgi:tetratricopeptide (TPR) repeat protein
MTLRPLLLTLAALALAAASPARAQAPDSDLSSELQACLDASEDEAEAETGLVTCKSALNAAVRDIDRAGVQLKIASLWLALGDADAAIAAVDKAAELAPEERAEIFRADVRYWAGRYDDALNLAEAGLARAPDDPGLMRLRLLSLANLGRQVEARPGLERIYRKNPRDLEVTAVLANLYAELGEVRQMNRMVDAGLKIAPNDTELRYLRGALRLADQDWRGAAEDLDIALAAGPDDGGLALRAIARVNAGDPEGARSDLAAIQDPGSLSTLSALYATRAAALAEEDDRALIFAEAAVAAASDDEMATALVHRGEVKILTGDLGGAQVDFEKTVVLEPQNARAWGGLGRVLLDTDPAESSIYYGRAAALAPGVAEFQAGAAEAAYRTGDYGTAGAAYDRLIKGLPDDYSLHAARAQVFMAQGRYKEGLASSTEAVRLAPDDEETLLGHVEALAVAGDSPAALALLDRLAANGSESPTSRYLAALILRNQGEYERALREAEAGLVLAPDDPALIEEKGTIYYLLDDPLSAKEWLDRAVALDPGSADALYLRGLVRAELGDAEGGAADQAAAVGLDPSLAEEL